MAKTRLYHSRMFVSLDGSVTTDAKFATAGTDVVWRIRDVLNLNAKPADFFFPYSAQTIVEELTLRPWVFARGKFTFNKRFVETKFAGFIGELLKLLPLTGRQRADPAGRTHDAAGRTGPGR